HEIRAELESGPGLCHGFPRRELALLLNLSRNRRRGGRSGLAGHLFPSETSRSSLTGCRFCTVSIWRLPGARLWVWWASPAAENRLPGWPPLVCCPARPAFQDLLRLKASN